MVCVLQDWIALTSDMYRAGGGSSIVFAIFAHLIGAYLITTVYVAVILSGFSNQNDDKLLSINLTDFTQKKIEELLATERKEIEEKNNGVLPKDDPHALPRCWPTSLDDLEFENIVAAEFENMQNGLKQEMLDKKRKTEEAESVNKNPKLEGQALYFFGTDNVVRQKLFEWTNKLWYVCVLNNTWRLSITLKQKHIHIFIYYTSAPMELVLIQE